MKPDQNLMVPTSSIEKKRGGGSPDSPLSQLLAEYVTYMGGSNILKSNAYEFIVFQNFPIY